MRWALAIPSLAVAACQLATDFKLDPVPETSAELCVDERDGEVVVAPGAGIGVTPGTAELWGTIGATAWDATTSTRLVLWSLRLQDERQQLSTVSLRSSMAPSAESLTWSTSFRPFRVCVARDASRRGCKQATWLAIGRTRADLTMDC
jgi:hypothetical protein